VDRCCISGRLFSFKIILELPQWNFQIVQRLGQGLRRVLKWYGLDGDMRQSEGRHRPIFWAKELIRPWLQGRLSQFWPLFEPKRISRDISQEPVLIFRKLQCKRVGRRFRCQVRKEKYVYEIRLRLRYSVMIYFKDFVFVGFLAVLSWFSIFNTALIWWGYYAINPFIWQHNSRQHGSWTS